MMPTSEDPAFPSTYALRADESTRKLMDNGGTDCLTVPDPSEYLSNEQLNDVV